MSRPSSRLLAYTFLALCLSATAASAQFYSQQMSGRQTGQRVASNGKCLEIEGNVIGSGARILLRDCAQKLSQEFQFAEGVLRTPPLTLGFTTSTYCVTVNSGRADMPPGSLTLEVCYTPRLAVQPRELPAAVNSAPVLQQWSLSGGAIRRADGAACFDTGINTPAGLAIVAPCNGGPSQQWSLQASGPQITLGGQQIVLSNGRCLDVEPTYGRGSKILVRDCSASFSNQRFEFVGNVLRTAYFAFGGSYGTEKLCVTVDSGTLDDAPPGTLTLEVCRGDLNSPWPPKLMPEVYYNPVRQYWSLNNGALRRADGAACFDAGNGANNGAVFAAACNGSASQRWSVR